MGAVAAIVSALLINFIIQLAGIVLPYGILGGLDRLHSLTRAVYRCVTSNEEARARCRHGSGAKYLKYRSSQAIALAEAPSKENLDLRLDVERKHCHRYRSHEPAKNFLAELGR